MKNLFSAMAAAFLLTVASAPNLIDLTYTNINNKPIINFLNENPLLTDIDASVNWKGKEKVEKIGFNVH